ncbi:MAG: PilN domain-containing protein [Bradyrhizobium sp.]|uniref:PilN domain-containing protein n=1 Tax=Bradyrhizobium sp. TaxID=376 RepID=UPI001C29AE99|nr:PilN domain-containing protein [Bradyrhizobium sp.]MBU6463123.1 PilN domain-containing protein [Pseudomonadota bacterium]MDE2068323.1 PilN domain-containing protein [Bradyrhizobium sp.]
MSLIAELKELFSEWIAVVAGTVDVVAARLVRSRRILIDQGEEGTLTATAPATNNAPALPERSFSVLNGRPDPPLSPGWAAAFRGSRVEMNLSASQVLASPLDFPSQAGDFLDGMIRSQVDCLTPWSVNDVVFGWSTPTPAANARIEMTFAATSKNKVHPLLKLAQMLDAGSVAFYATVSTGTEPAVRIKLFDQRLQSSGGLLANIPRLLRNFLLAAGVAAAASLLIAAYLDSAMESQQSELQHQISQRRAALRLDSNGSGSGLGLLAKRKQNTPSSVMVLEAISRALPDTTYVTELRIEGDKVQIVGMTQDAPSLVRLLEQSPQFSRATFFAPTTRAANETGERFHIEAHITAYFGIAT